MEYLRSHVYMVLLLISVFIYHSLCVSNKTATYPIPVSEVSSASNYNSLSLLGSESTLLTFITKLDY